MTPAAGWRLERRAGAAGLLHQPWPERADVGARAVAVCSVEGNGALVLGSTQPDAAVDRSGLDATGIELVRRGSGGGAVFVRPGAQVWIDAWVPPGDALWSDDIVRAPQWLGDAWVRALDGLGAANGTVHRGRSTASVWSPIVCFAGLGPGEVSVGGRKVVGLSQRRTRHGVRISTMAMLTWDPVPLIDLLALPERTRSEAVAEIGDCAVGLRALLPDSGGDVDVLARVTEAVLAQLPGAP